MIIDYILKNQKVSKLSKFARGNKCMNEGYENPLDILRSNGIKIKNTIPHQEYMEIFLFNDVNKINFDIILKNFYFVIDSNENKIYIKYERNDRYEQ